MTEFLIAIGGMSMVFVILCALSDWAVPRLITLRRRKRIIAARKPELELAPMMSEEYR